MLKPTCISFHTLCFCSSWQKNPLLVARLECLKKRAVVLLPLISSVFTILSDKPNRTATAGIKHYISLQTCDAENQYSFLWLPLLHRNGYDLSEMKF